MATRSREATLSAFSWSRTSRGSPATAGPASWATTGRPTARPRVSDLRIFLRQELEAAYDLMSDPDPRGTGLADVEFIESVAEAVREPAVRWPEESAAGLSVTRGPRDELPR